MMKNVGHENVFSKTQKKLRDVWNAFHDCRLLRHQLNIIVFYQEKRRALRNALKGEYIRKKYDPKVGNL